MLQDQKLPLNTTLHYDGSVWTKIFIIHSVEEFITKEMKVLVNEHTQKG